MLNLFLNRGRGKRAMFLICTAPYCSGLEFVRKFGRGFLVRLQSSVSSLFPLSLRK